MQERMRRLEALRLELDSRRRTVADLQGESNGFDCLSTKCMLKVQVLLA